MIPICSKRHMNCDGNKLTQVENGLPTVITNYEFVGSFVYPERLWSSFCVRMH
jgi:hypothetical protein